MASTGEDVVVVPFTSGRWRLKPVREYDAGLGLKVDHRILAREDGEVRARGPGGRAALPFPLPF